MKRALLLCIVGLLCMGAIPYAAIGWDFPGDITVQDDAGIGTDSPTARLDVKGTRNPAALTGVVSPAKGQTILPGLGTKFKTELAAGNVITLESQTYIIQSVVSDLLVFLTSAYQGTSIQGITAYRGQVTTEPFFNISETTTSGLVTPMVTVTDDGFVGIGTDYPLAKLQVNGSIIVGSGTGIQGRLLCWDGTGRIGYCDYTPSGHTCNCVSIR